MTVLSFKLFSNSPMPLCSRVDKLILPLTFGSIRLCFPKEYLKLPKYAQIIPIFLLLQYIWILFLCNLHFFLWNWMGLFQHEHKWPSWMQVKRCTCAFIVKEQNKPFPASQSVWGFSTLNHDNWKLYLTYKSTSRNESSLSNFSHYIAQLKNELKMEKCFPSNVCEANVCFGFRTNESRSYFLMKVFSFSTLLYTAQQNNFLANDLFHNFT